MIVGIDPSFTSCGVSDGNRHITICTKPVEGATQAASIDRRCMTIVEQIAEFIGANNAHVYIEGPAFGQQRGASHLYELGWLMRDLYCGLHTETAGNVLSITEVNPSTLRKWATGKGNTPKAEMKLRVFKKFGVEFEDDPGCDKLFAFLLARYGMAHRGGEIDHKPAAKRGGAA